MREISIQNLTPGLVPGIQVQMPGAAEVEKENYFEWAPSTLIAPFNTKKISGGVLRSIKQASIFREVETHTDMEMFYFISGVGVMIFSDLENEQPLMDTVQLVRVQPGTQIIIPPGKAHYVPIAENDEPMVMVVVAPKMGDLMMELPEPVIGIG